MSAQNFDNAPKIEGKHTTRDGDEFTVIDHGDECAVFYKGESFSSGYLRLAARLGKIPEPVVEAYCALFA